MKIASIQRVCEEVVLRAARHAHALIYSRNLVTRAALAQLRSQRQSSPRNPFQRIWIQPAAGDVGGALGAALLGWHHGLGRPRVINVRDSQKGSFLGPSFSKDDIGLYLDSVGAVYRCIEDDEALADGIARLLMEEKIIGWF
jgi:carbamoyltransferase